MAQTWLADDSAGGDRLTYEPVFCLACSQQHFICAETGRALGDRVEAATVTHGPTFPPGQSRTQSARGAVQSPSDPLGRAPAGMPARNHAKAC
ncbi:hypothetical protein LPW26_01245 [Rhodopseudomonas sp. HC1]|uniref:hypothetical protein n=1 Tax=Rhodopseudomonas infernalis TaxID=2897386 RepID=UPI001EE95B7A|nr:hypothetical protein [Rhodopseudomonas infernalis]MCG6203249.1 hypothetical protein [Rhodopseudomonas infernalis]